MEELDITQYPQEQQELLRIMIQFSRELKMLTFGREEGDDTLAEEYLGLMPHIALERADDKNDIVAFKQIMKGQRAEYLLKHMELSDGGISWNYYIKGKVVLDDEELCERCFDFLCKDDAFSVCSYKKGCDKTHCDCDEIDLTVLCCKCLDLYNNVKVADGL